MRRSPLFVASAILAAAVAAQPPLEITITSSPQAKALAEAAGAVVQKRDGDVRFKVTPGPNARVVRDVTRGEVMAGVIARELTASERTAHEDLVASPLALDGLAVIVNEANPLRGLTSAQLADLYLGKIVNWESLGGADLAVQAVVPSPEEGAFEAFCDPLRLELGATKRERVRKVHLRLRGTYQDGPVAAEVIAGAEATAQAIAARPGGVGLVPLTLAQRLCRRGSGLRAVPLDGVAPTVANLRNETYPLRQTLYLLSKGHPAGRVRGLIELVRSAKGEDLCEAQGLVPLQPAHAAAPGR